MIKYKGFASILAAVAMCASLGAQAGTPTTDLTYTPLPNGRCRIANTSIAAEGTRNLVVTLTGSYASQGGTGSSAGDGATNCGIPANVAAIAVSGRVVPALAAGVSGVFKVYEYGATASEGNTIRFAGSLSAGSDMIVKSCQPFCSYEISVYSNQATSYVLDVIGYFMQPVATALQCVDTADTITPVNAGDTANSVAPACAAGYTQTATNCETSSWEMPLVYFSGGTCSAKNNSSGSATLRSSRTCCRVPGR